ncbi:MAG: 30S ribosomal protein S6 [Spirochaetes bacterium]|jgi:small subunit ribosomal protein S6|nr:30S ribosomal protein S6 [Spirochaetota bacterium]
MRTYELTTVVRSNKLEEGKEAFASILTKHGVTIKSDEDWGQKKLAYPINDQKEAYYIFKIVEALPEAVEKVANEIGLNEVFLRSMFVLVDEKQAS